METTPIGQNERHQREWAAALYLSRGLPVDELPTGDVALAREHLGGELCS